VIDKAITITNPPIKAIFGLSTKLYLENKIKTKLTKKERDYG